MRVTIGSTIRVEDPTPALSAWCREHLVVSNPEYAKKARLGLWLGRTPEKLYLYLTEGNTLVLPFGCLVPLWEMIADHATCIFQPPVRTEYEGPDMNLFPYQREAVSAMIRAGNGILQAPAGSGKTQMALALVRKYARRALWLTHTLDLLKQSRERAAQFFPRELIGTITEGKAQVGEGITFATVQTLSRMDQSQYRDTWDVIIVDECHRVSGTPTSVTQFYKVLGNLAARHKFGLSATVHRADGMIAATYALLGNVAYTVPASAVQDRVMQGYVRPVFTGTKMSRACLNTDGTINYAGLIGHLAEDEERLRTVLQYICREKGHSCLILSDRLNHLAAMLDALPPDMRREAVMVTGRMTSKAGKAQREKAMEDMRQGTARYLFASYALAKEGLDIPRLDRLFLTTPQTDSAIITQAVGRVARVFPGKGEPIVYDFVDDVGLLAKGYKKRMRIYRKLGMKEMND